MEATTYYLGFRVYGLGLPKIRGTFLGGPNNKGYRKIGSLLGSPCCGKLPYMCSILAAVDAFSKQVGVSTKSWGVGV